MSFALRFCFVCQKDFLPWTLWTFGPNDWFVCFVLVLVQVTGNRMCETETCVSLAKRLLWAGLSCPTIGPNDWSFMYCPFCGLWSS
jgi:hypothetical protein